MTEDILVQMTETEKIDHDIDVLKNQKRRRGEDDVFVMELTLPDCAPVEARTGEAE